MKKAKKAIALLLVLSLTWATSFPAWAADDISLLAGQGQDFGREIMPAFGDLAGADSSTRTVTVNPGGGPGSATLDLQALFPGANDPATVDFEGLYGNNSAYDSATTQVQGELGTENSPTGEAYRTMVESLKAPPTNLQNDALWDTTKEVLSDVFQDEYSDCEIRSRYNPATMTSHLPDIKSCQRVYKPVGSCTINHDYSTDWILQFQSGHGGIVPCGAGCLDVYIGQVGNNYLPGNCTIHEQEMVAQIITPEAITSATLEMAKWDDYMQIYLNGNRVWYGPSKIGKQTVDRFPPETEGACELSTEWVEYPSLDVTSHFRSGGNLYFKIRVSVGGKGEGYARIRVHYDPGQTLVNDAWTPQECLDRAGGIITEEFCTGTYECVDMPPSYPCVEMPSGVTVCENQMAPSPLPGISPLCRRVNVNVEECGFNVGQMDCWTDPQGIEHCPYNDGSVASTCDSLATNPACRFMGTTCVEGAQGADGTCYVLEDRYDCGQDVVVNTATTEEVYTCEGEIRCMGDECVQHDPMADTNFAKAAATLNAAQFAVMDLSCGDIDQSGTGTWDTEGGFGCTVFGGEPFECKKAVGGWQDCCESPQGVSLADYINLLMATNKIASAKMWLAGTVENPVYGSWTGIKDGAAEGVKAVTDVVGDYASQAWEYVSKPLVQGWESIAGTAGDAAANAASSGAGTVAEGATSSVAQSVVGQTIDQMTAKLATWVYETFGEAATNALFSATAGSTGTAAEAIAANGGTAATSGPGAVSLGGMVGSVLGPIMWAYTAYAIANLLVQIIWECEEKEFELGTKRQLKVCTYLGTYCANKVLGACVESRQAFCCYNSPLSRILNEQIRAQLGLGYGALKAPNCQGIALSDLDEVDWSRINLDEWIGILSLTGHLPEPGDPTLTPDGLTGSGSAIDVENPRPDVIDRTKSRLEGSGLQNINDGLRDKMWQQGMPVP